MTLFNVTFTSLTPLAIGMFDRDVDKATCLSRPQLYKQGQQNLYLSFWAITGWLASAFYQSAIIMSFMLVGCASVNIGRSNGQPFTMWETGVTMFSIVLVTVHIQVIQVTEQWTVMHHVAIWLSQGGL